MDSGRNRGGDTGGIGIGNNYRDDAGWGADLGVVAHEAVGGMKSLIFWAALGLVATFSASWIQSQPDPAGDIQVAQQQVVQPQFPAQALGRNVNVPEPPTPPMMREAAPSAPPLVMPRAVPGVPGPPPQAQPAVPSNTPPPLGMMQRRGVPPPMVTRTQPAQPQAPAPVQTAIPFSR